MYFVMWCSDFFQFLSHILFTPVPLVSLLIDCPSQQFTYTCVWDFFWIGSGEFIIINKNAFQSKAYHPRSTYITKTFYNKQKYQFLYIWPWSSPVLDNDPKVTETFKLISVEWKHKPVKIRENMMFYSFDLDLDPMTLILKLHLDMVKMYLKI